MLVITPFQEILIEGLQEILTFNETEVDLYYVPLMPIDFVDVDIKVVEDDSEIVKEIGVSKDDVTKDNLKTV